MPILKIINPIAPRKRKLSTRIRDMGQTMTGPSGEKIPKYKHRPVFYSDDPARLGIRSTKKVLNKRRKAAAKKRLKTRRKNSKLKLKLHRKGIVNNLARKRRKTRTRRTHNKAAANKKRTYRRRTNPVLTKTVYRNRRRNAKSTYKRSYRRRRRNPDILGGGSTTEIIMKSGAAAAGGISAPWITNVFGISGNMKYLAQLAIGFVGFYIINMAGFRKYATPFATGVIAVTAYNFASDKGLLAGLGQVYTPGDYSNIYAMNEAAQLTEGMGSVALEQGTLESVPLMGDSMINMESEN